MEETGERRECNSTRRREDMEYVTSVEWRLLGC
jgi:hypothetical protein